MPILDFFQSVEIEIFCSRILIVLTHVAKQTWQSFKVVQFCDVFVHILHEKLEVSLQVCILGKSDVRKFRLLVIFRGVECITNDVFRVVSVLRVLSDHRWYQLSEVSNVVSSDFFLQNLHES